VDKESYQHELTSYVAKNHSKSSNIGGHVLLKVSVKDQLKNTH
jgi:hypothetical protein